MIIVAVKKQQSFLLIVDVLVADNSVHMESGNATVLSIYR